MCNYVEKRTVKGAVVVSMEQCRTPEGDRAFIPKMIDPGQERYYRYPDWITGFEVVTPKGETIFVPIGSWVKVAT